MYLYVFPVHLIHGFQHISCIIHYFMLVQIYLTSQAGLTETRTGGERYGLRRLVQRKGLSGGWGEEGGEKIFLGGERHPRTTLLSF